MKFYDRNKELELTTTLRLVYLLDCKPTLTYIIQAVDKSEGLSDYRRVSQKAPSFFYRDRAVIPLSPGL